MTEQRAARRTTSQQVNAESNHRGRKGRIREAFTAIGGSLRGNTDAAQLSTGQEQQIGQRDRAEQVRSLYKRLLRYTSVEDYQVSPEGELITPQYDEEPHVRSLAYTKKQLFDEFNGLNLSLTAQKWLRETIEIHDPEKRKIRPLKNDENAPSRTVATTPMESSDKQSTPDITPQTTRPFPAPEAPTPAEPTTEPQTPPKQELQSTRDIFESHVREDGGYVPAGAASIVFYDSDEVRTPEGPKLER